MFIKMSKAILVISTTIREVTHLKTNAANQNARRSKPYDNSLLKYYEQKTAMKFSYIMTTLHISYI